MEIGLRLVRAGRADVAFPALPAVLALASYGTLTLRTIHGMLSQLTGLSVPSNSFA